MSRTGGFSVLIIAAFALMPAFFAPSSLARRAPASEIFAVETAAVATAHAAAATDTDDEVTQEPASPALAPWPQDGFTDITQESGIHDIVAANYAAFPRWWLSGVHFVDLDGDGTLDFYMGTHGRFGGEDGAEGVFAALNDGTGRFRPAPGHYPTSEILLAHDLTGDGRLDLVMNYTDGGAEWWLNHSTPGRLEFENAGIRRAGSTGRIGVLVDIDGDGHLDWIRSVRGGIVIDRGDGEGGFIQDAVQIPISENYRNEHAVTPADLNNNGKIDLVIEWGRYGFVAGMCRILRNDGDLEFTDVTEESGLWEEGLSVQAVGDFNRSGFVDILALEDLQEWSVFLNDGTGRFTKKENAIIGMEGRVSMASWGLGVVTDFDNDGLPDILVNGKHFLKLLRGDGEGRFTYMNRIAGIEDYSASSIDDGLCFGDITGNGMLDIAGYRRRDESIPDAIRGVPVIYRNDLPPQNWLRVRPLGRPGNAAAAGAVIRITEPETGKLLWHEQVSIFNRQAAQSYYGLTPTERHFGLGARETVDVSVRFHPSGKVKTLTDVAANATVEIHERDADSNVSVGERAERLRTADQSRD